MNYTLHDEQRSDSLKHPGEIVTCAQAAQILRAWNETLTAPDRQEIADGIEEARHRMNAEHLDER